MHDTVACAKCKGVQPRPWLRTHGPSISVLKPVCAGDDVQHWVWLLGAIGGRCSSPHTHARLQYLAKVSRLIGPQEAWMRLLVADLGPAMNHLHDDSLPPGKLCHTRGKTACGVPYTLQGTMFAVYAQFMLPCCTPPILEQSCQCHAETTRQ